MAKRYDPILCMMVDDSVKTEDRDPYAYEEIKKDIQIMKSGKASYITKNGLIGRISHSYNNRTITKEQKTELMNLVMSVQDAKKVRDSAKAHDAEKLHYYQHSYTKKWYVVSPDGKVFKEFNTEAEAKNYVNGKAKDELLFYQLQFSSGKTEGAKLDESEIRSYAEALLEKYGEKRVTVSRQGKIVATYFNRKAHDSASTLDKAIKTCDASTGHKVVVFVENYLRSIGKNNSTGKYDKIVQGVKSLLSQSLLDDEGLKKAAEHEADRLLKKYNL